MTQEEIAEIVRMLADIYNAKEIIATGYVWALEDLPADTVRQAARELVKTSRWMPKPSELREVAAKIADDAEREANRNKTYWRAMALYNEGLAGRLPVEQVDVQPEMRWFRRHTRPGVHLEGMDYEPPEPNMSPVSIGATIEVQA